MQGHTKKENMELSHLRRFQIGYKQAKMVKVSNVFEHFDMDANRKNDVMISRKNRSRLFAT